MTIKIDKYTDPFTHHVYNCIDADIRTTFSPKQVHAIETAIRANKPFHKHPVDVRGTFPLFFMRLYFVLLVGRDKRQPTRHKESIRRKKVALSSALFSVYIMICMLIPIGLVSLYILKSFIGIDLIEGIHMSDFF